MQLVNVRHALGALDRQQYEARDGVGLDSGVRPGDRPRVDEPPPPELVDLIPVRVSRYENVRAQLSLRHRQGIRVPPGHDLVAVGEAHPELAYLHDFRLGERRGLFEVSPHYVHVRRQSACVCRQQREYLFWGGGWRC